MLCSGVFQVPAGRLPGQLPARATLAVGLPEGELRRLPAGLLGSDWWVTLLTAGKKLSFSERLADSLKKMSQDFCNISGFFLIPRLSYKYSSRRRKTNAVLQNAGKPK